MTEKRLIRREFIKEAQVSEKVLKQWESANIIKPKGYTDDNIPFYSQETLEQINNIKRFLNMGYTPAEIQNILNKIGLPKNNEAQGKYNELKNHLTIGGLAEQVCVSSRTIKHWEDKGIIEPDMRSEGGFRLYSHVFVYLCNLIKDLQLFGYTLEQIKTNSEYFREFLAISGDIETYSKVETTKKLDAMLLAIEQLTDKMNLLKEGISRWEELINKKKKEIDALKKKNQKRRTPAPD